MIQPVPKVANAAMFRELDAMGVTLAMISGRHVSFIYFVSGYLEDTAGIGFTPLVSALMTIPAVIRTCVALILC